jgi:hypothetical protein
MLAPQVLLKISQLTTPIVPPWKSSRIKKIGGPPNLMEMDDTIKRQEVKDNEEELCQDMRSEDEDYEVEVGKFNFHEV